MKIAVIIMNSENSDGMSIENLQKNYFDKVLKEKDLTKGEAGRYRVTDKGPSAIRYINDAEIVLFKYLGNYIAKAKIKEDENHQFYYKIDETMKKEWKYAFKNSKEDTGFNYYYQFDIESIKSIPPIPCYYVDNLLTLNKGEKQRIPIIKGTVKNEKEFNKLLSIWNNPIYINTDYIHKKFKKLNVSLLKEVGLYSYENIHTSFFTNFIKNDNIYGLKDKPMKLFLDLLKEKNAKLPDKIDSFEVLGQLRYKDGNKNIIPDITINLNNDYVIIIEAKVCAYQNIYENEVKQAEYYQKYFEENNIDHKKYIYVFLTMREEDTAKNYIHITFKDIINKIYKNQTLHKSIINYNILKEYLQSFALLCDERFNFKITDIPCIYDSEIDDIYDKLKDDVKSIVNYNKSIPIYSEDKNIFKYLLVILYNYDKNKEEIQKCYDLIK